MGEDTTSNPSNQRPEADAISDGATNRAVLILVASLSVALDRLPIERNLKHGFLDQLENRLAIAIQAYNVSQAEIDWLTGIYKVLWQKL